jgi:hypothetical protein
VTPNWFSKVGRENMLLYMKMYLPVLLTCCIITVGYVVMWVLNGGDIDLGSPNARV